MKIWKKGLCLFFLGLFFAGSVYAQLSVNITANRDSFCFGDTTLLRANVPGLPTFNTSLQTTFANNNGQDGNMFSIVALNDVVITGFAHHPNAGIVPGHEIYFKTGTHVGFENNPAAWTLINTANNFPAAPNGTPTNIPGALNVFIPAGQTYSFYLTTTGHGVDYTNGTAVGNIYTQDANIQILEGTGNGYPFGAVFQPRIPNIVVYYQSPAQINYLWNTGATTQNLVATASGPTQYSVTVTDSAGNTANDTITLLGSNVIIDTFYDTICNGQLYNGVGYTSSTVLNNTYTAASTGCDSVVTVFLTVLPTPSTGPHFVNVCYGDTFFGAPRFFNAPVVQALTSSNGCDSTAVAVVTIINAQNVTISDTVCAGQPYNGVVFANDTNFIFPDTSRTTGCDSNTTVNLTVVPPIDTTIPDTVQAGSPYNGVVYLFDTLLTTVYTAANGCDSIVRIDLIVEGALVTIVNDTVCRGQAYNGIVYQNDTSLLDSLLSSLGADSLVITNLTVITLSGSSTSTICYGENYRGFPRFSDTTFIDTLVSPGGCDSIHTENLIVSPLITDTVYPAICQGTGFLGYSPPADTIAAVTLTASNGCDSLLVVDITVNDTFQTVLFDTICEGQSLFVGGGFQSTSGSYTDILSSTQLCDSTVITNLFVRDTVTTLNNVSICNGQFYFAGGANQGTSGTYFDFYTDQNGCDSAVITNLVVNDTIFDTVSTTLCQGSSFFAGGSLQTTSGIYYDMFPSVAGCDSIVVTFLTVNDTHRTVVPVTICEGQNHLAGGNLQSTSGTYFDTLSNSSSCDSIIVTQLTVNDTSLVNIFDTICEGQSIFAGGAFQNTSGVYIDVLSNSLNCDSTIVTNLFVYDTVITQIYDTICEGGSYLAGGALQTTTGTYFDFLTDRNSCDSVVVTNLYVHDTTITVIDTQICEGQQLNAGGGAQSTSGTYTDVFTDGNGCDSVVIVNLLVTDTTHTNVSVTICEGTSYFVGGANQTTAGLYTDILTDVNGCDSLIFTTLNVNDTAHTILYDTICEGQSLFVGGSNQTSAGTYIDVVSDVNGCDSTLVTNLWVHDTTITRRSVQICEYDSFFVAGQWQNVSGTYSDVLIDMNGCDSLLVTNLIVTDTTNTRRTVSICEGQSIFVGGANQFNPGVYLDNYTDQSGCDSLVITNLVVFDTTITNRSVSICDGDAFFAGGGFQTTSGVYTDIYKDGNGCDSTVITDLSVLPNSATSMFVNICVGDAYFAGGAFQTTSGIYFDTLVSANGCDSVITTDLNVYHQTNDHIGLQQVNICQGDSYFVGGANQTTSGIYIDTLYGQAWTGCDSVVRTQLTVNQHSGSARSIYICQGDSYFVGGGFQTSPGLYRDTLINANGCDSVISTQLTVKPLPDPVIIGPSWICGDQSAILSIPDTFSTYQWVPGGENTNSITARQPGNYTVSVTDQFGCSGIASNPFNLSVIRDFISNINPDSTGILIGDSVNIDLTTSAGPPQYIWYPAQYLSCTRCEDPTARPAIPMTYNVIVTDSNGCSDTGRVRIEVNNEEIFFVPNILVIDSDIPENNRVQIYGEGIKQVNWSIFNRWGERIFHTEDINGYWDGTYKGEVVSPGVYSYSIQVIFEDGLVINPENAYRKGTITVVR